LLISLSMIVILFDFDRTSQALVQSHFSHYQFFTKFPGKKSAHFRTICSVAGSYFNVLPPGIHRTAETAASTPYFNRKHYLFTTNSPSSACTDLRKL
jgi:hypothetical protein